MDVRFRAAFLATLAGWSLLLGGLLLFDLREHRQEAEESALREARAIFEREIGYPQWVGRHGGVYVPAGPDTQPNPDLTSQPERDVTTPSGRLLTLVDPAKLARQAGEKADPRGAVISRLTSLRPVRPQNAPDAWEAGALRQAGTDHSEVVGFESFRGAEHLRLLRPLRAEATCLSCHGRQGYQPGDVLGGFSVSVPMRPFRDAARRMSLTHVAVLAGIWALATLGAGLVFRRLRDSAGRLAASQSRFRAIFEASTDAIGVSRAGRHVIVNDAYVRMFGYASAQEVLALPVVDLIAPGERPLIQDRAERRSSGEPLPAHYETRGLRKDGSEFLMEVRVSLYSLEGVSYTAVVLRDITETRQMERALAESRAQLAAVIDSATDAILSLDDDGKVLVFNAAAERMFGVAGRHVLGGSFDRFVRERLGQTPGASVTIGLRSSGQEFPLEVSLSRTEVEGRRVRTAILRDLSQRQRAEQKEAEFRQALQAAAEDWQRTFDAMESAVLLLDADGRVARLNRTAGILLGDRPRDPVGLKPEELGTGEPWVSAPSLLDEARQGPAKARQVRDPFTGRFWEVGANPMAGGGFILLARDVTSVVQLQRSAEEAERMAAMGTLTAGVAHEVRNPLFAISANADALGAVLHDQTDVADLVGAVKKEVARLSGLMTDLLEFGRPPWPELRDGRFCEAVEPAVRNCRALAETRGVAIEYGKCPEQRVRMDRRRLGQIFENLVENAIQHSPSGSSVRIEWETFLEGGREWVRCRVADAGPGFAPQDLKRVFEPFFTRRRGGTGLGLSIAQRIAEQHGGRIRAGNGAVGGAVMEVELPCA